MTNGMIVSSVLRLAEGAEEHSGPNHWLVGGVALGILLLLLLVTTRFNADR